MNFHGDIEEARRLMIELGYAQPDAEWEQTDRLQYTLPLRDKFVLRCRSKKRGKTVGLTIGGKGATVIRDLLRPIIVNYNSIMKFADDTVEEPEATDASEAESVGEP